MDITLARIPYASGSHPEQPLEYLDVDIDHNRKEAHMNPRFVFTGGPGSGKTSTLEVLYARGYTCVVESPREKKVK